MCANIAVNSAALDTDDGPQVDAGPAGTWSGKWESVAGFPQSVSLRSDVRLLRPPQISS